VEAQDVSCLLFFPFWHYMVDVVQIHERPKLYQCVIFGIQHVLAMFSGTVFIRKFFDSLYPLVELTILYVFE
jgi:hypothetical protein